MTSTTEPTYQNQLTAARRVLAEKGLRALQNPHAAIGKMCGCGSCFCCAALEVAQGAAAVEVAHNRILTRQANP